MVQDSNEIIVEVAYALPGKASVVKLQMEKETTVAGAIEQSGLLEKFPDIDLRHNKVGVFSKLTSLDTVLKNGDRVEIYRPLRVDPGEARRRRAKKKEGCE